MKKIVILVVVVVTLVTGSLLANNMLLAKNSFNGLGKVLVQGAAIDGANGIMFDDNDMLYIASAAGREILVMDPKSGGIVDRLGTDLGIDTPDDLTFGPDGSLYWTAIMTGEVGRLKDGVVTTQFVAPGVNPITFSDDGRLFVALDFMGDGLYELDPDLVAPPTPIIEATPSNPYPLGFLNGMDWGPDGYLYGPLWLPGLVVRIDVDTASVEVVAGGFSNPGAVKFDSEGNLYVVDPMAGEISCVDILTGDKDVIATGLLGLDNLAFNSRDQMYISNAADGSIHQVLPSGRLRTVSKGGMIMPGGVAVMSNSHGSESVFVADYLTLREFNGKTGRPGIVEQHDIGVPGDITSPFTVSADGNNLVISSYFGNSVQVWDPTAGMLLEEYVDFLVPLNAIRFQGDLVVAELMTGSVVQESDRVAIATGLYVPTGLAATDEDLWVSDWATGCVWQVVDDGEILATPILVASDLSNPEGLAVNLDGNLLVVEAGAGRLSSIDIQTGEVSVLVEGLELVAEGIPGLPPTRAFNGVAVGPSGYIYVTGDATNVLYRFKPTN